MSLCAHFSLRGVSRGFGPGRPEWGTWFCRGGVKYVCRSTHENSINLPVLTSTLSLLCLFLCPTLMINVTVSVLLFKHFIKKINSHNTAEWNQRVKTIVSISVCPETPVSNNHHCPHTSMHPLCWSPEGAAQSKKLPQS